MFFPNFSFKVRLKKYILIEIVAFITVWLVFMKDAISEQIHTLLTTSGVIVGTLLFVLCTVNYKIPKKVYYVWFIFALLGAFNILLVGALTPVNYIPMLFFYFPIAIYFYYSQDDNYKLWEINYYIYAAYLIYRMLNAVDGYYMFYATSRNMLSMLLLIWLSILYMVFAKAGRILPLRCIIIFFIGCFVATGRGGIISGVVLLSTFWLINTQDTGRKKSWKGLTIWLLLVAVSCVFIIYVVQHFNAIFEKYLFRFTDEVSVRSSNARLTMWKLYLSQLKDPYVLFLGGNTYKILPPSANGNLHNSFLMVHAKFGLLGFVYVCYSFIVALFQAIKVRDFRMLALIIVFAVRSLTDQVFPAKVGDIALWIFILYSQSFFAAKNYRY